MSQIPFFGVFRSEDGTLYDLLTQSAITPEEVTSNMIPFYGVFYDKDGNKHDLSEIARGGGIPDAPPDGKIYGRKDASWEEVTGSASGGSVKDGVSYLIMDDGDGGFFNAPIRYRYVGDNDPGLDVITENIEGLGGEITAPIMLFLQMIEDNTLLNDIFLQDPNIHAKVKNLVNLRDYIQLDFGDVSNCFINIVEKTTSLIDVGDRYRIECQLNRLDRSKLVDIEWRSDANNFYVSVYFNGRVNEDQITFDSSNWVLNEDTNIYENEAESSSGSPLPEEEWYKEDYKDSGGVTLAIKEAFDKVFHIKYYRGTNTYKAFATEVPSVTVRYIRYHQ